MKRTTSSRTTRLTSHASEFSSSVTLFEFDEIETGPFTRHSKRPKTEPKEDSGDECLRKIAREVITEPLLKTGRATRSRKAASDTAGSSKGKEKRPTSPKKPKAIPQSLVTPHPAPPRWREAYDAIKNMRSRITAPVDTMGCDRAQLKEQDPKNQRFATLVSLMLSSQTKDEVTDAAISKLRETLGGSISVDALLAANEDAIANAICKVGFWRRKTGSVTAHFPPVCFYIFQNFKTDGWDSHHRGSRYLKQTAQRLHDDFNSDVPKTVDELCSLPGVGPKMAFLTLQVAWNLNVGIGVDVHVHRITNRLKWHKQPTKNPEETRAQKVVKSRSNKSVGLGVGAGPKLEIAIEQSTTIGAPKSESEHEHEEGLSPLSALSTPSEDVV
ncbi:hypothetical protein EW146_g2608 [Bondarzewia mesenterica]|uniref:HhH-GPD domain-containing protein n=1 Tax=Bondarzewia mesenterica TaxID=1095465 RepID=A0A4S4M205_9AGAM|nr:hypothetical protein EW146_g2608 [Bondarzewia mesenterica]